MLKFKFDEKFWRILMLVTLGVMGVIVLCTFRDYGVTWDEELQSQYGLAIVDYYTSLFADQRYQEIYNLYLYGGMFDGLASAIDRFTPFSVYETRHLVNAIFGLAGLWGVWRLGKFFGLPARSRGSASAKAGGGAVGYLAMILVALTPMYYGHMFNNPKDVPFAAGIVWSMVYMAKSLAELPRIRWRTIIKLGVILGFALGIRVGGAMALCFWGFILGLRLLKPFDWRETLRVGLRLALPVAVISYIVMLACWPWAQQSPILNPLHALNEFKDFPHDVEVLLNGKIYHSSKLPWFYVPLYFGVQLPEFMLFLIASSFVLLPWIWREDLAVPAKKQAYVLILIMALAPIVYAMVGHPALYDAVRHFLFVVPLMAVPAALAGRRIYFGFRQFLAARSPFLRKALGIEAGVAVFLIVVFHLWLMAVLHPYEYIYANQFTGGVAGAFGRYELDYWGSSFKEAAADIQAFVAKEGGVPPGKIYRIAICGPWDSAMIYLPPDYEPVVADQPAEFFLSTTRWMCQGMRAGREIIRVQRLGVPLAVVKDLRKEP